MVNPPRPFPAPRRSDDLSVAVTVGILAASVVVVAVLGVVVFAVVANLDECHCPSSFYFGPVGQVPPGSIGCAATAQEVCYSGTLLSSINGLQVSDLSFKVLANGSGGSVLSGPPVPLGPGAQVTLLSDPTTIVGVWNWTSSTWIFGGDNPVPYNTTAILDTGLVGTPLEWDMWWTFYSSSEQGGGGWI